MWKSLTPVRKNNLVLTINEWSNPTFCSLLLGVGRRCRRTPTARHGRPAAAPHTVPGFRSLVFHNSAYIKNAPTQWGTNAVWNKTLNNCWLIQHDVKNGTEIVDWINGITRTGNAQEAYHNWWVFCWASQRQSPQQYQFPSLQICPLYSTVQRVVKQQAQGFWIVPNTNNYPSTRTFFCRGCPILRLHLA